MKKICMAFAAGLTLAAVPLAACAQLEPPRSVGAAATQADRLVLTGERGFALAELAYTVAAQAAGKLVDRGVIAGPTATRVRGINAKARGILVDGKAAADQAEKAVAATNLLALTDQLNALRGGL